ncbi:hypothetical protein D3C81_1651870 [compost metagenome]
MVDHRGAQRRQGAGATAHQNAGAPGRDVQFADTADERTRIGQIEVMRPCRDGSPRHAVILVLERAGGGDHQIDLQLGQAPGKGRLVHVQTYRLATHSPGQVSGALAVAPGDQHAHAFAGSQATHDDTAEIAVAAQHQDTKGWGEGRGHQCSMVSIRRQASA